MLKKQIAGQVFGILIFLAAVNRRVGETQAHLQFLNISWGRPGWINFHPGFFILTAALHSVINNLLVDDPTRIKVKTRGRYPPPPPPTLKDVGSNPTLSRPQAGSGSLKGRSVQCSCWG